MATKNAAQRFYPWVIWTLLLVSVFLSHKGNLTERRSITSVSYSKTSKLQSLIPPSRGAQKNRLLFFNSTLNTIRRREGDFSLVDSMPRLI